MRPLGYSCLRKLAIAASEVGSVNRTRQHQLRNDQGEYCETDDRELKEQRCSSWFAVRAEPIVTVARMMLLFALRSEPAPGRTIRINPVEFALQLLAHKEYLIADWVSSFSSFWCRSRSCCSSRSSCSIRAVLSRAVLINARFWVANIEMRPPNNRMKRSDAGGS